MRPRKSNPEWPRHGKHQTFLNPKKYKTVVPFLMDFIVLCLNPDPEVRTPFLAIYQHYIAYVSSRTTDKTLLQFAAKKILFAKHLRSAMNSHYCAGEGGLYSLSISRWPRVNPLQQPIFTMAQAAEYLALSLTERPLKFRRQYINSVLGHGGVANSDIFKDEILIEYRGEVIDSTEKDRREELYAAENRPMTIFSLPNGLFVDPAYRLDGSKSSDQESIWTSLNHSRNNRNVIARPFKQNGHYHILLVATTDICAGRDLNFDYGDRRTSIPDHVWLKQ